MSARSTPPERRWYAYAFKGDSLWTGYLGMADRGEWSKVNALRGEGWEFFIREISPAKVRRAA